MSSASSIDSRFTRNPVSNKMKSTKKQNSGPSPGFTIVLNNRKPKHNKDIPSPVSPSLQQIIDNPQSLCNTDTAFNYNNIFLSYRYEIHDDGHG